MGSNLMRTATFGDRQVIRDLQKHYVLLWHDQHPGLTEKGEQTPPTAEQIKAYPEGAGGTNVLTYVSDPNGRVVYKLTGFWRGERYLKELKFARDLSAAMKDDEADAATKVVTEALTERRKLVAAERAELASTHPAEFAKPVRASDVRKQDAALGLLEQSLADPENGKIVALDTQLRALQGRAFGMVK